MAKQTTQRTLDNFFKRKLDNTNNNSCSTSQNQASKRSKDSTNESGQHENQLDPNTSETPRQHNEELDLNSVERDPGKRKQIWSYPVNKREQVRRAYISLGPYQIHLKEYPAKGSTKHPRKFQYSWFSIFPNWLEYSPTTHSAYCFLCYLYSDKPNERRRSDVFIVDGFDKWKKVNDGHRCAFLKHLGSSQHKNALAFSENLLNQDTHIENILEKRSKEKIYYNRLKLKASVDVVQWLTFQACAFRGHDERPNSKNRGNFLQLLKLLASYNDELANVIMDKAHYNSKYTSGDIQKELLSIIADNVRKHIRAEVGNSYFCVMVDESRDESKSEQMAIVLRFVDKDGIIKERFLDMVHVSDTSALTLKNKLWKTLLNHEFDTSKLRGQGYDGASNMRGEWNGLQALVLKECPYAYYVHCFAHRLQLALVAASREVIPAHQFFDNLAYIINVVCASSKRHDELQKAKAVETKRLLELGEIKSGKGANQARTLRRAGDTRWGSHLFSVNSVLQMYNPVFVVLRGIIRDGSIPSQRADADKSYCYMKSFEFVFILHLVLEIMGRTNVLSQSLQRKSQDIANAIELVSTTKKSLDDLRNKGWDSLLKKVILFCRKHEIDIPDLNAPYRSSRYRPRLHDNHVTFEHHYRVDIFIFTLDKQLHELNYRFNDHALELLSLSYALVPKRESEGFDVDQICLLVEKCYPEDFTEQERVRLKYELELLSIAMKENLELSQVSTLAGLCTSLAKTEKRVSYPITDKLIRLILTLPVSTATTERAFSAMKICKNRLRNKMADKFLADSLVVYIEKEIAETFSSDNVIDCFKNLRGRKANL